MLVFLFFVLLAISMTRKIITIRKLIKEVSDKYALPSPEEFERQQAREAWTKLGEVEVERFLAPYTTPDEQKEILPASHHLTDAQLEEIRLYADVKTLTSDSSNGNVLHALDPTTICLPESWSGQARLKAYSMHTERNCPLGWTCPSAHLDD